MTEHLTKAVGAKSDVANSADIDHLEGTHPDASLKIAEVALVDWAYHLCTGWNETDPVVGAHSFHLLKGS